MQRERERERVCSLINAISLQEMSSTEDLDQVDWYVAIADFEAAESTNTSLTAGQYVQVCRVKWYCGIMIWHILYVHVTLCLH